jgi:hypothetical protein
MSSNVSQGNTMGELQMESYEIKERLKRIRTLAKEIEAVENLPQPISVMKEIDEKSRQIVSDVTWIEKKLFEDDWGMGC